MARIALAKKTGARGLRAILEQTMLDVMYDIPSNDKIAKVLVTHDSILGKENPKLIEGEKKFKETKSTLKSKKDIETAS